MKMPTVEINLNKPKVIATIIRYFRVMLWKPDESNTPLVVPHGIEYLAKLHRPLEV